MHQWPGHHVHSTAAATNLRDAEFDIAARTQRQKPCRTEAYDKQRKAKRTVSQKLYYSFFMRKLGDVVDNNARGVPKSARGRNRLNAAQARFRLRNGSKGSRTARTKLRRVKLEPLIPLGVCIPIPCWHVARGR